MSGKAILSFDDDFEHSFNVYQDSDGHPDSVLRNIAIAYKNYALHSYNHSEFASAYIRAAKNGPGKIYLLGTGEWEIFAPKDISFLYYVGKLGVSCWTTEWVNKGNLWDWDIKSWKTGSREWDPASYFTFDQICQAYGDDMIFLATKKIISDRINSIINDMKYYGVDKNVMSNVLIELSKEFQTDGK